VTAIKAERSSLLFGATDQDETVAQKIEAIDCAALIDLVVVIVWWRR